MSRATPLVLTILALALPHGSAAAQSFDCAKAASASEKRICASPELSFQDALLAAQFRSALAAQAAQRDALLAQQRQWLQARDARCGAKLKLSADQGEACLDDAYRARIAALAAQIPIEKTDPALCRRIVDLYRGWAAQPAIIARGDFGPENFLTESATETGPIRLTKPSSLSADAKDLQAWAAGQQPPAVFPNYLLEQMTPSAGAPIEIDHPPRVNFYAAQTIAGTAHCYNSVYFTLTDGAARAAVGPQDWENEDGGGCGASRFFGALDDQPVALQVNDLPFSPDLTARLTVMDWNKDHFSRACAIAFTFAPRFALQSDQEDPADNPSPCVGPDCAALKVRALTLVEQIQRGPCAARQQALDALTPDQKAEWTRLDAAADKTRENTAAADCSAPENLTDQAPLIVPLVDQGKVFRAEIGHATIGWRVFTDWKIALTGANRKAIFTLGMAKGPALDITVK